MTIPTDEPRTIDLRTASGAVPLTFLDQGAGRPFLLLHGGAGPASMTGFAQTLAARGGVRAITPTLPGFDGTSRPDTVDDVPALAAVLNSLLNELGLNDVVVVGNSLGGWLAAELALRHNPRVAALVICDAVGLTSDTEPIADFFSLTMDQVTERSYADADRFRMDVEALSDEAKARMAGNRAALAVYGGTSMADPSLQTRLTGIDRPALVVWGAADHIVPVSHGRAYAAAIPGAELTVYDDAGHLPQLETPERLLGDVLAFADRRHDR